MLLLEAKTSITIMLLAYEALRYNRRCYFFGDGWHAAKQTVRRPLSSAVGVEREEGSRATDVQAPNKQLDA